jgi:hypothetical protein
LLTAARRFTRGIVFIAAVLLAQPTLAADPKPDVTIKTKAIEASVFLDSKIKADPALAADCLAEGRKCRWRVAKGRW